MNCRLGMAGAVVATMLVSASAQAQPEELMASGMEDDASLELTMLDSLITSDPNVWCRIDIVVDSAMVGLSEGDTITVSLIEDDLAFNDTVWEEEVTLTAEEAAEETYEATFNCGAAGSRDGIGQLEFFAQVDVDKALCTGLCFNDNPTTTNIDVDGMADDELEEDDDQSMAMPAELDVLHERVAADVDVAQVNLPVPGTIAASIEFMPDCGEVMVEIVDEDGTTVAEGETNDAGMAAVSDDLPAGAYFVVTQPVAVEDLNFYDIIMSRTLDEDPGGSTGGDDSGSDGDDGPDPDDGTEGGNDDNADDGPDDGGGPGGGDGADDGADDDGGGSGSSGGSGPGQAGEEDGCGCRHTGGSVPAWFSALILGFALRRRRTH